MRGWYTHKTERRDYLSLNNQDIAKRMNKLSKEIEEEFIKKVLMVNNQNYIYCGLD